MLRVGRERGDLLDDLEPLDDPSKDGVLTLQAGLIAGADEELRAAAVWGVRNEHARHCARGHRLRVDLPAELVEAAGAVLREPGGILRQRIAGLDDPVANGAMERGPGVRALTRQLDEEADVIRRELWQQLDDEGPVGRRDHRLFALRFGVRIRRLEKCLARLGLDQKRDDQQQPRGTHDG